MIQRFFIEENLDGKETYELSKEIQHQLKTVLKTKSGEKIVLFDGSGYDFISIFENNKVKITEKVLNRREPEKKVFLFQSIIKKDNMEWVFQKGTECGIFEFVPILTSRSIKKDFNAERAKKIVCEAAEQSGRSRVPVINDVMSFKEALEFVQKDRISGVIADPNSKKHIFEVLKDSKIGIFIGPEGGWTEEEISEAKECGFKAVSLGKLNLRAETAAIAASWTLVQ